MIDETNEQKGEADLLQFRWTVRPKLYRWITAPRADPMWRPPLSGLDLERWLQTARVMSAGRTLLTDSPLEPAHDSLTHESPLGQAPQLFIDFTHLNSEDTILEFARQYGPLGGPTTVRILEHDPRMGGTTYGEPLVRWMAEIQDLREVVEVWRFSQEADKKSLNARLKRKQDEFYFLRDDGTERPLASPTYRPKAFRRLARHNSVLDMAQYFLASAVNRKLWEAVAAGLVWNEPDGRLEFHIIPRYLLAYLWVQFARAASGTARVRACRCCGKWMLIEPPESRRTRLYCSDACRQRMFHRGVRTSRSRGRRVIRPRARQ